MQRDASDLPFVGREQELERLRDLWERATQRRGSFSLVGGEAGVGKSRLVETLAALAESCGACVLRGHTTLLHSAPYEAVVGALRTALPLLDTLGSRRANVASSRRSCRNCAAWANARPRGERPITAARG